MAAGDRRTAALNVDGSASAADVKTAIDAALASSPLDPAEPIGVVCYQSRSQHEITIVLIGSEPA